jgi:ferrochelatase
MAYFRAASQAASTPDRIGVLLVNLGTPDSPSYGDVRRYLREFLGDRRVIETSRLIWLPLLYGLVLPFRPFKTAKNYRKIWLPEGSPLAVYSARLTAGVAARLHERFGADVRIELAMTYGNPSVASAVHSLAEQNVKRLLVLPLFPHYCSSTTGAVFDRVSQALRRWRWLPETRFINDYYDDVGYVDAVAAKVERHWEERGARSHLLFSYHGIPASYVANGDPYQGQAEATTRLVTQRLGLEPGEWSHCYQSRFGRVEWLKPYTIETIKDLVGRGIRKVTVVSPSFAVDCLETLEEVAIEYRDQFLELGGEEFSLVPGLNDDARHVQALSDVVGRSLNGWTKR